MTDDDPGVDTWTKHATAFDRVRAIAQALDRPRTAGYIADDAAVSPTTANDHLTRLVEMNVVRTVESDGATAYAPDPLYVRFQTLRELLETHDHDELLDRKAELQDQLGAYEREYDVVSPTALRERAATTDSADETVALKEAASDWELTQYHVSVVDDAIEHYAEFDQLTDRAHA
ncbi:winged helix-turn-helix domain-containing protein [Halovivax cerinus]|uniref:Winged helix-turn-helix domain-containing protein n=1 Tax=Halovivax cerinus TaxID=1487865 RepID=A0ABD5NQE3_9EURY|nr:winged helix-turn-helix domain-containing protein [Halovivax cerinus]